MGDDDGDEDKTWWHTDARGDRQATDSVVCLFILQIARNDDETGNACVQNFVWMKQTRTLIVVFLLPPIRYDIDVIIYATSTMTTDSESYTTFISVCGASFIPCGVPLTRSSVSLRVYMPITIGLCSLSRNSAHGWVDRK